MTEKNPERITLDYIINSGVPNHNLSYCPSLAAAQKTGHPKNGKRIKGVMEQKGKKTNK